MKILKKLQKGLFHPAIVTINLIILLTMGFAFDYQQGLEDVIAANGDSGTETSNQTIAGNNPCLEELDDYASERFVSYQDYMEIHFTNKSATSDLMDDAVIEYQAFEEDIRAKLAVYFKPPYVNSSANSVAGQAATLSECQQVADQYIEDAQKLLELRAVRTSEIKKTSILLEKYQQINAKMRVLNLDVLKMATNFAVFEKKLPCYLKNCI